MAKAQADEKRREYATKAPDAVQPLTEVEKAEKIAALQAEIEALNAPVPVLYPKWKYHPEQGSITVADAAAEKALGAGWVDTPEAFPAKKET